jgi:protein-disulfide isomerase
VKPTLAGAARQARRELRNVSERRLVLGNPRAPVEIIEYADLASDTCARIHRDLVPAILDGYVRRGTIRLELRLTADSPRAVALAHGAYAASLQHRGWEFVQAGYLRRLPPPDGGDTPAELAAALGLNATRFRHDLRRPEWTVNLNAAASVASVAHFRGAPVFLVRRPGQTFTVLTEPRTMQQVTDAIVAAARA